MDTKMNFDMYVPTHTLFGAGMLNYLHSQKMPGKKALLVISNGKSTKRVPKTYRRTTSKSRSRIYYI